MHALFSSSRWLSLTSLTTADITVTMTKHRQGCSNRSSRNNRTRPDPEKFTLPTRQPDIYINLINGRPDPSLVNKNNQTVLWPLQISSCVKMFSLNALRIFFNPAVKWELNNRASCVTSKDN
ncbi:hypothetical protein Zmor_001950 [Zophobas morio]|uniref:Uncharacterized protein n=1 Tax=Zophobas morio TaxID=2755281 RepID=A0AA38J3Q4_9CUCU|nr:hypothetical protein Zmor_001950 [Zophobas morio]